MQVVEGDGRGDGVGFDVTGGDADDGEADPGRVLVAPAPGVLAEGWATGLEAPALVEADADEDAVPEADAEELGRALPVRCAPAVGSPTTGTEPGLAVALSVAAGSPTSGAEAGAVASE
ncbi:hypothetical protein C7C46_01130 [Streptomyces tateyamensis]|uniref:Uncharacterized protein n=1 Tax=Streptomyces tateyamensis TaxID=565073 RepID=A0A2V4PT17_9ACTN|nr:hypothetical protein [Streptomyces tateyamensis]PYC88279.1 hypothetical protein C7C46_01130 [Streptomyces tateyamensis]